MQDKKAKVSFGNIFKVDEITEATYWNPDGNNPKEIGGFCFGTYKTILRWLIRGDTIYDVIIPNNADVIKVNNASAPNKVFITNKIILTNPQIITDDIAMYLYEISDLPKESYYKSLAGLAIRGYVDAAKKLIQDKINTDNIDLVLSEFDDFVKPGIHLQDNDKVYNEILKILYQIKTSRK